METALEMYYLDNGRYPNLQQTHTWHNGANHAAFETALAPYMTIDLSDPLLGPYWVSGDSEFLYTSVPGDNYQSFAIGIQLIGSGGDTFEDNDGGYFGSHFELGQIPKYCQYKYTGADASWWHNGATICVGGN